MIHLEFDKYCRAIQLHCIVFMAKIPAALFNSCQKARNSTDVPAMIRRGKKGQKRNFTHVEAVNNLLISYETDDVRAKTASKFERF